MDDHEHSEDIFGSERRPPLVVDDGDHELIGTRDGSVCVHAGSSLTVRGTVNGSVSFRAGSSGTVNGTINGSVHVANGVTVDVVGAITAACR